MKLTEALLTTFELKKQNETAWPELLWRNFEVKAKYQIESEIVERPSLTWPTVISQDGALFAWVESDRMIKAKDLLSGSVLEIPLVNHDEENVQYDNVIHIDEWNDIIVRLVDNKTGKRFLCKCLGDATQSFYFKGAAPLVPSALFVDSKNSLASLQHDSLSKISASCEEVERFKGRSKVGIDAIQTFGDGRFALTCDKTFDYIMIWDIEKADALFGVEKVTDFAVLSKSDTFLCARSEGLLLGDSQTTEDGLEVLSKQRTEFVAVDPDERYVVALDYLGRGLVYDLKERKEIAKLNCRNLLKGNGIKQVSLGVNRQIIFSLDDGQVLVAGKKKPTET